LQALELLTRNTEEIAWIKGTDLRERVRGILGQTAGHMMQRYDVQPVENEVAK